jgi:hypothetical protein
MDLLTWTITLPVWANVAIGGFIVAGTTALIKYKVIPWYKKRKLNKIKPAIYFIESEELGFTKEDPEVYHPPDPVSKEEFDKLKEKWKGREHEKFKHIH